MLDHDRNDTEPETAPSARHQTRNYGEISHTHTHTHTPSIRSVPPSSLLSPLPSLHLHPSLPCSRLWRLSCACWCSSSTHSGLLHEPNTFTLCCHGDLKWAAPPPPPPLLLPPPPPLMLLWLPSPWLLLLPPRLPPSASRPLVAGGGREREREGEGGREGRMVRGSDGWREERKEEREEGK